MFGTVSEMVRSPLATETPTERVQYLEALAVAAVFLHGGQDLMRGEPAELGIPAWLFAGGFFLYALAIPFFAHRPWARVALTGGVPLATGGFHLFASYHGGFYVPIIYATLVFGGGVLVQYTLTGDRLSSIHQ